jgi:uncharacterized protein YyaL (SSP411 family)
MIEALAQAGAVLGDPRYTAAAAAAAGFLLEHLRDQRGTLLHAWRDGRAVHPAYLDDYAAVAHSLVTLYEATFDEHWIDEAVRLADEIVARFADRDEGAFFYTSSEHASLIARKKDMLDSSTPSGGGLAAMALLRLGKLTGKGEYLDTVERALVASTRLMERAPLGTGQLLLVLDAWLGPAAELVILSGDDAAENEALLADLRRRFLPGKVLACRDRSSSDRRSAALEGIFAGKQPTRPGPTLFVCRDFACEAPVSGREAALAALDALGGAAYGR